MPHIMSNTSCQAYVHSAIRCCTDFAASFAKFDVKSSTIQCHVHCAVKVVTTRTESLPAMAKSVMFDTVLWDTGGLSVAIFRFEHLM